MILIRISDPHHIYVCDDEHVCDTLRKGGMVPATRCSVGMDLAET